MAQDTNRQKYIEALRRAAMGPRGVAGPDGNLVPMTSGTLSEGKSPSNLQKLYKMLPQGGYGVGQTVGPLATAANPLPSLKRTFTGENARQYLNFGEDGPGWKQRAMLAGEDALNIAGAASMADAAYNNTYALGKTVVHGSPQYIDRYIMPQQKMSNIIPDEPVAFAWDPQEFVRQTKFVSGPKDVYVDRGYSWDENLFDAAQEYAGSDGTIYIAKAKRGATQAVPDISASRIAKDFLEFNKGDISGMRTHLVSTKPLKVVNAIDVPPYGSDSYDYADALSDFAQELVRRGVKENPQGMTSRVKNFPKQFLKRVDSSRIMP